jgi:mRNA interferase HicA
MAGHGSVWRLAKTTVVLPTQHKCCIMPFGVTSQEFKRWLAKQGCTFEPGHGGHLIVRLGTRMSVLPMHGKQKELGTGLVTRIKKDLGLK